jgi:Outer membrane protein beta-barrel domain
MTSQAQITLGLRGGVNVATYHYKSDGRLAAIGLTLTQPDSWMILTTAGVPIEMGFSPLFALQAELNFIQKGQQRNFDQTSQNERVVGYTKQIINWLEIPILAKIRFGSNIGVGGGFFFGPSIGYGIDGKIKQSLTATSNGNTLAIAEQNKLDFKKDKQSKIDFGLNLGGEAHYGGIFLDVRYQFGLTNMIAYVDDTLGITAQTRGFALSAGYRLPIGLASKKK